MIGLSTQRVIILVPPTDLYRYPEMHRHMHAEYRQASTQTVPCERCKGDAFVQQHHLHYFLEQQLCHARGEVNLAPIFICYCCADEHVTEEANATGVSHVLHARRKPANVHYDTQYL